MKILLTGANGYIGTRLIPVLLNEGHEIFALVRRPKNFHIPPEQTHLFRLIEGDLLDEESLKNIPKNIEAAFYLVHSMNDSSSDFMEKEKKCAENFIQALKRTNVCQLIYLSGLSHDAHLSKHLTSRNTVETILTTSSIPYTVFKAGIIIGSGSASFEMIRDLVEKLPIMITPKWVKNRTQPIAVADVLFYLKSSLGLKAALNQVFEIGGPDILTYREMMQEYARIRGLKRKIIDVPVLTPRLSSYWLYFVTSTNFSLAKALVDSLRNETICTNDAIQKVIPHICLNYQASVERALSKIEKNEVASSWKSALSLSRLHPSLVEYMKVPIHGCFVDEKLEKSSLSLEKLTERLWSIGGTQGWYYANWAWRIRGIIDKCCGGTGLNRGRTHPLSIEDGDVIDFWRVLIAEKEKGRLLLYAEMRLPGEAWLEFQIIQQKEGLYLKQTATFRPKGLLGRLYWYVLYPFHFFIFRGMARKIALPSKQK